VDAEQTPTSWFFPAAELCSRHTIFPGVHIRTIAAEKMMLSVVDLEPHAVVEEHHHPHEQVGMLLEGEADFIVGGQRRTLRPGDLYRIPGNVPHKVIVGDRGARALDIFHPVREDYR
jgi:quercetin dioxygenase-like cupin family protein